MCIKGLQMKFPRYHIAPISGAFLMMISTAVLADPSVSGEAVHPEAVINHHEDMPAAPLQPAISPRAQAIFDQLAAEEKGATPSRRSTLSGVVYSSKPSPGYPEGR